MRNKGSVLLIHGATNTSNFGDVLFAALFYDKLSQFIDADTYFVEMPKYGIGKFARKELNYQKHISLKKMLKAKTLVYMSGGYFGDDKKSTKLTIRRFVRYFLIGLYFSLLNKDIYICGVGGGPIYSKKLRKIIIYILNHAKAVTMRDQESADYFRKLGVTTEISVTSDTALLITKDKIPELDNEFQKFIDNLPQNHKLLFFHVSTDPSTDKMLAEKVIPAVNKFLNEHNNYSVVFGMDGDQNYSECEVVKRILCNRVYYYQYSSAWKLCAVLNAVDLIITPKLHVGIIGSSLSKSVLSFPIHSHKTERFYKQIGEENRCVKLKNIEEEKVLELLNLYHGKNINITEELREKASINLSILNSI